MRWLRFGVVLVVRKRLKTTPIQYSESQVWWSERATFFTLSSSFLSPQFSSLSIFLASQSTQSAAAVTSQQNPKKHRASLSAQTEEKMVRKISKNEEEKQSFFKLLAGFNTDCVRIPQKFLKHMLKDLSARAILKLKDSSDSSWTVTVNKTREGAVYFKNGWEEFIKDNSLGTDNEMLQIFYEGKMHFSVRIFGKNGIERTEELSSSEEEEEDSEDNTSEDLEADFTKIGSLHNSLAKNTTKRPRGRPRKYPVSSSKPRPSKSCKVESGEELSSSESIELNEIKEEEEDSEDSTSEDLEGVEPEAFKSNFPYFKGIIRQTKCQFIPTAFSREHFPQGKGFKAILKNAEGGKWTVNCIPNSPQSHNFSAGWYKFASANQIRIGDTCIFELLSRYQMMVHILRKR
ncbi:unnamed protein product [Prunus armeniaca]